jgi:hypothetical protein
MNFHLCCEYARGAGAVTVAQDGLSHHKQTLKQAGELSEESVAIMKQGGQAGRKQRLSNEATSAHLQRHDERDSSGFVLSA